MGQIYIKDMEKIEELKRGIESGALSPDDVPEEYINIMNVLYKLEADQAQDEVNILSAKIEEYKTRMRAAIDFLKGKR